MASIDENINSYLYSTPTLNATFKAFISNISDSRNGYYGQSIAAVTGFQGYIRLSSTKIAKGYQIYVNDETNSYQTGDIVRFNGTTYTVGPIVKPTLNVKTARFFDTTSIAGSPISGVTKSGNRKATTFDISINLT